LIIRLGLFSLLAILAVSVFLTSCEQEAIIPDNPLGSQESNQDMSHIDLKAYHNYLNSVSKEDFEVSEAFYTQIDELNVRSNQIQMTNITSLMKLDDDASSIIEYFIKPKHGDGIWSYIFSQV